VVAALACAAVGGLFGGWPGSLVGFIGHLCAIAALIALVLSAGSASAADFLRDVGRSFGRR